jgi:hypothetical protein
MLQCDVYKPAVVAGSAMQRHNTTSNISNCMQASQSQLQRLQTKKTVNSKKMTYYTHNDTHKKTHAVVYDIRLLSCQHMGKHSPKNAVVCRVAHKHASPACRVAFVH